MLFRQSFTGDISEEVDGGEEGSWTGAGELPTRFPAQSEMGKIFYRSALAAREVGKTVGEVRMLVMAAAAYLPHDEIVQKEKRALEQEE